MDAEELRNRAAHYRKLAEREPPGDMRDELMRVVAALKTQKTTSVEISNACAASPDLKGRRLVWRITSAQPNCLDPYPISNRQDPVRICRSESQPISCAWSRLSARDVPRDAVVRTYSGKGGNELSDIWRSIRPTWKRCCIQ
jgi:hypothetical protein